MGGVETHCQELFPRLVARGHQVTLFGRAPYLETKAPYEYRGIKVIPLWAPKKKSQEAILQTFLGVLHVVKHRNRFDLLHIHAIGPALLVPIAKIFGIPVVMTHHGPDYDRQKWGRLAKSVLRMGESFGCRCADAVITVSRHIASLVGSQFHRNATYIPNGVNLPVMVPPGAMVTQHQLVPNKYVLSVGRFVPEKGFHDLLKAFSACNTDWKLVIAGDTDHEDDYSRGLKQQAARDSRVLLTGFIRGSELAEVFSNAGLFVLPSYHEGLPIALLEAVSYNLPILASDIPANLELADASETFPVGDVAVLSGRLEQLTTAGSTKAAARHRIEHEFNWDVIAAATEKVYCDVMGYKRQSVN
ncbi:MAG: glycosyltransferase family 4 protein [Proteobacteria bacterium]|nr:glycosyltransferase family 4 protein [Pseudomonadota bacterium]